MWKTVLILILLVLAAVAALLFATAGLLFHGIYFRPKRSKKVPKAYVGTPHYVVSRKGMAYMDAHPPEDVTLTSRDGLTLHAYLYLAPGVEDRKKFVLGIHGYRSYARPEYGPYIAFYHRLGYHMLLPDDRAHAPSQGKYIGFGILDRLDCVDWAGLLVDRFGPETEILLHGVSMGGATVLAASGEADLPKQVFGVVSDCGYSSLREEFSYHLKHSLHLPLFPLLPIIQRLSLRRAGIDIDDCPPLEQVKKARVPILFVQGGKDTMVPPAMVRALCSACAAPHRLLMVEEAGHAESIALAPEAYHQAILDFFGIAPPEG